MKTLKRMLLSSIGIVGLGLAITFAGTKIENYDVSNLFLSGGFLTSVAGAGSTLYSSGALITEYDSKSDNTRKKLKK